MSAGQMQMTFGLPDAERNARDVCRWVRDNGSRSCVKQGEIEAYVRQSGIALDVVGEFRHNRNLYPGLTRYMVMLRPRLARSIRFRRSKLDELDLAAIWHEVVDPNTVFLASSRMEAEHLVAIGDVSAA